VCLTSEGEGGTEIRKGKKRKEEGKAKYSPAVGNNDFFVCLLSLVFI
jgi:hypothetical protein